MIDIQGIKEALPHRYPMLLVDRVLEVSEDTIVAIKNVTINEPFFNGHFPQYPVMPGVLIMEALAQTAGVLELSKPENKGKLVFYAGMDKVKFKKQVVPGDPLTFLIDDILRTMAMNQKNYFVLNKENTKDGREHRFYFRVVTEKECPRTRTYAYAGLKNSSQ